MIERDTVFQTQPDSTFYNALIECQNGIPILKSPVINKSKAGNVNIDVSLQGNQLNVNATKEAEKLFAKWKEEHIKENSKKEIKTPYPVEVPHYIEKQLTWWQKLWITLGKISGLIISVFILIKIPWRSLRRLLPF